jgi:hypothetical protein
MAHIKIAHEGCAGTIEVDGVPLQGCVTEAAVRLEAGSLPTVEVRLVATSAGLDLKNGQLKVGAFDAPQELERALLAHLTAKYQAKDLAETMLRLPVVTLGVDMGAGDDVTAFTTHSASGTTFTEVRPKVDPMEATRALCKRNGGSRG